MQRPPRESSVEIREDEVMSTRSMVMMGFGNTSVASLNISMMMTDEWMVKLLTHSPKHLSITTRIIWELIMLDKRAGSWE